MDDLLTITEPEFSRRFREPTFGLALAEIVRARHRLPEPLIRHVEGSSLVFRIGDGRWLKLTPPFFAEFCDAELRVARAVAGRLPVPVPAIEQSGEIEGWRYIVSAPVPGVQIQHVMSDLGTADYAAVAADLGDFMRSFHGIQIADFGRDFGPWPAYLARNIRDAAHIHRARGNSADWADAIAALLAREETRLARLGPPVLVHGDLIPEHVMLHRVSGRWRLAGVLDLADAMLAPAELDAAVPMLDIFRGQGDLQRRLLRAAGISVTQDGESFSLLFMAIALLHPFAYFHDWFSAELHSGLASIPAIARCVFPQRPGLGGPESH